MMKDFLITALLALCAYISPVYEFWLVMLVFVLANFITAIFASKKEGEKFSIIAFIDRAFKSVVRAVCYMAAILLSHILQLTFELEWLSFYRYVGAFICVIEFLAVLKNLAVITDHSAFLKLIKLIRGKASKNPLTNIINEKIDPNDGTAAGNGSDHK